MQPSKKELSLLLNQQFSDISDEAFISSLNPAAWFIAGEGQTVTGSGVSQWSDQSGNARHLLQGTDANRPVSLDHSGTNYLYLPGVAGNYASTPDSAANSVTGDIDIRVRVSLDDWTPSANQTLVSKYNGGGAGNTSYLLRISTTGELIWYWAADGATGITKTSTANLGALSAGAVKWVRVTHDVDNGAAGNDVKFWSSDDGETWAQLGSTVTTASTTSLFDAAIAVKIGANGATGTAEPLAGRIYQAIIKSGIDGTTVFDADFTRVADSATSFTESSSNAATVTINSTGSLPAQIVGRSSVLFNGSAHYLKCNAFTLNQPTCVVMAVKPITWTSNRLFCDGNSAATGAIYQIGSTPFVRAYAGADINGTGVSATLGAVGIHAVVFNGASSSQRINMGTALTGNAGASNMGGFTLGANATGANPANIQVLEVAIFPSALTTSQLDRIVRYMMGKYRVA